MSWLLRNDTYTKEDNKHYEGAFTQGNGYMNVRGTFSQDLHNASQNDVYWRLPANVTLEKQRHPYSKWGTYIPGIYGNHPILGEEIINLPYALGMNVYCKEHKLDMELSSYDGFYRQLNMENGEMERGLKWNLGDNSIDIRVLRHCNAVNKHLIIEKLELTATSNCELHIEHFLDASVTTNGYSHFKDTNMDPLSQELYVTTDTKQHIGVCITLRVVKGFEHERDVRKVDNRLVLDSHYELCAGETLILEKRIFYATSIDDNYCGDIRKHLRSVMDNRPFKELREAHDAWWFKKWERSDVHIKGNAKLQEAVRFSIYHLLRSANDSSMVAVDAKGYAGEAYYGHYFWDTEMYLLPFYIYTQPEQAKRLIKYRYSTLEGAKANAARYGYEGARYPWESCITGKEQCSNWQYADLEVHVTADVIYGLIHYCENSGDHVFLLNEGLEMMIETARYWMSRVYEDQQGYHLKGVMGPDEYLPFTDNNTFTNYLVIYTLEKTVETIKQAKVQNPMMIESLGVKEEEISKMKDIVNGLVLLVHSDRDFIEQCENFAAFEDVDFNKVWTDRSKPFGQFISQEKNYRSKALKQADVVALLYLFREQFSKTMKQNCLEFYEPITTHDSSLSYIFHALVYLDIQEMHSGYSSFLKSIDIDWGSKGAAEGIHIANCGGIWQAMVLGFGGLKGALESKELKIEPKLPPEIEAMCFSINYRGDWYKVELKHDKTILELCG